MQPQNRMNVWWIAALWRLAVTTGLTWAMMALYLLINHRQSTGMTTVEMPSWVPFWPAFFPPYVGLLLMTWLLPVALRDADRFRACLRAYACAWLLVVPWWIFTPTMLPRPPLPDGIWAHAFKWIWEVDQPFNVTPCAHAVGPIVAAWFAAREYPAWRWPLGVILLLTLPSIALVWQHRPIDIVLGAVAAGIGIAVAETLVKWQHARALLLLRVSDEDPGSAPTPAATEG
jgi:hypothetical protein